MNGGYFIWRNHGWLTWLQILLFLCDLHTPYLDYKSSPLGSILSQANRLTLMTPFIPIHFKTLPPTSLPKLIISFGILQ